MTPTAAQQLAEAVVADGFGAHRAALAALFAGARRHGVNPTLVAVAADPTEPVVARQRALGHLVVEYHRSVAPAGGLPPAPPPSPDVAAAERVPCSSSAA